MGMDLIPRKKGLKHLHFNWFGWGQLGDLLEELGCDLSLMRGTNDGDYIPASVCRSWANALVKAVIGGKLGVVRVKARDSYSLDYDYIKVGQGRPLDSDDTKWVLEAADFLNKCSGCKQC